MSKPLYINYIKQVWNSIEVTWINDSTRESSISGTYIQSNGLSLLDELQQRCNLWRDIEEFFGGTIVYT
jgi:hypothetical protein